LSKWNVSYSTRYERDYKTLADQIQNRVDEALIQLSEADNPRKLGRHKYADWDCVYSYDIGRKYRILYEVYSNDQVIFLVRVGSHAVYDR
jgi:addiction module RelE/StbE family toxin